MIVVDTSALIAVLLDEPPAETCLAAIGAAERLLISAETSAELHIVAAARGIAKEVADLAENLGLGVVPVTALAARRMGDIYRQWSEGFHPAGLNFGDCFAYELATNRDCPLLFVGDDFAKTDMKRALS